MNKKIEKLYKSSLRLLGSLSLEDTYCLVVKEAMKLVGADAGSILLEEKGVLRRAYSSNPSFFKIHPRKRGYMYSVYKNRSPRILSKTQILKVHPEIDSIGVRSDLVVPLYYEKKRLGVLSVISKKNKVFNKHDLALLKLLGPLASLAIIKGQLYKDLQNAINTRDLFISLASHELKTPLTTLTMYSDLLKKRIELNKKIKPEWIELIHDETKWLNVLFNELLQTEQIQNGKFNYQWKYNNVCQIVERARRHFEAQHKGYTLKINCKIAKEDLLYSDFDKLLQAFTNLLGNAAKFSLPKHPILFTIEKKDDKYFFEIQDKGSGIHNDDLPNIYNGFYKGKNNTKRGMGLGLYIVKEIINIHHGTISIKSQPKSGTKVQIEISNS